jgi:hypothetical protein
MVLTDSGALGLIIELLYNPTQSFNKGDKFAAYQKGSNAIL